MTGLIPIHSYHVSRMQTTSTHNRRQLHGNGTSFGHGKYPRTNKEFGPMSSQIGQNDLKK